MSKRAVPKSRFVVIENVYFQEVGKQPTTVPTRNYTRWLDTDEQPYIRHMVITEEWKPLDIGWIENASLCILFNAHTLKKVGHSGLTDEQKVEVRDKTIEVSLRGDNHVDLTILPGESVRISPVSVKTIQIRIRTQTAKCLITLLPG